MTRWDLFIETLILIIYCVNKGKFSIKNVQQNVNFNLARSRWSTLSSH